MWFSRSHTTILPSSPDVLNRLTILSLPLINGTMQVMQFSCAPPRGFDGSTVSLNPCLDWPYNLPSASESCEAFEVDGVTFLSSKYLIKLQSPVSSAAKIRGLQSNPTPIAIFSETKRIHITERQITQCQILCSGRPFNIIDEINHGTVPCIGQCFSTW